MRNAMSIRLKLGLLICSLFIAAIGNIGFTIILEGNEAEKLEWVNHTNEVVKESQFLLSSLKDAETGQRGFLLTRTSAYLQPYHSGLSLAQQSFDNLGALTLDNPEQQMRLRVVKEKMSLKLAELAETIELTQKDGNTKAALELVASNQGKSNMDDIRRVLSSFERAEVILLTQRMGDYKASRSMIATLVSVELVLFTFLAVFTFFFLQKSLFQPLDLLLSSTKKAAEGRQLEVVDIVQQDELGYLLSRFYLMNEKILERTQVLDYKAHHDELTGLRNRARMLEEIENAIVTSKTSKLKLCLFFIDLNDFKMLNDTLGHEAGDAMLKETATRLKQSLRSDDSVFRVGGDEFVVLISNIITTDEVQRIVENILEATETPVTIQGQLTKIKFSIGIAISPDDSINGDHLLKFADVAMYAAKRDKDTQYKFFDQGMLKRASDA
jgi:diguanylate cyclase (GGDEF)-like protein